MKKKLECYCKKLVLRLEVIDQTEGSDASEIEREVVVILGVGRNDAIETISVGLKVQIEEGTDVLADVNLLDDTGPETESAAEGNLVQIDRNIFSVCRESYATAETGIYLRLEKMLLLRSAKAAYVEHSVSEDGKGVE